MDTIESKRKAPFEKSGTPEKAENLNSPLSVTFSLQPLKRRFSNKGSDLLSNDQKSAHLHHQYLEEVIVDSLAAEVSRGFARRLWRMAQVLDKFPVR